MSDNLSNTTSAATPEAGATGGAKVGPDGYLSTDEAAHYLGLSRQTLDKMRHHGDGPAFFRITARAIRYRKVDLDAWMERRRFSSVAEYREGRAA